MAYGTTSLKLETARQIFEGVDIQPIEIAGRPSGYRATYKGQTIEDTALWRLAQKLWVGVA
jgi:hypothetical protein